MSPAHLFGGRTPEPHGHHAMCVNAPNLDSLVLRLGQRARVVLGRRSIANQKRTTEAAPMNQSREVNEAKQDVMPTALRWIGGVDIN